MTQPAIHKAPAADAPRPKVSIVLLDWGCRERFHALDWLAQQTRPRADYELLWVELYDRVMPEAMAGADWVVTCGQQGLYHKHLGYNAGLLLARGDVVTVCDSDAVFPPDFIASICDAFGLDTEPEGQPLVGTHDEPGGKPLVLMHHELRSQHLYPDGLARIEDIDRYPWEPLLPNAGACVSVTRRDAIRYGGFDEDESLRGYICGPYDLAWRLVNAGLEQRWHDRVLLWHFAHPHASQSGNEQGWNEIVIPHIQYHAAPSVEAFATGRMLPLTENAEILALRLRDRRIGSAYEAKFSVMAERFGVQVPALPVPGGWQVLGEAARCARAASTIDWRDIPVFIVNRNHCEPLRKLVDWLLAAGTKRVVILDNASDDAALLAYYAALPPGAKLMLLPEDGGPQVLWTQGVHAVLDTLFVVTEADLVPAADCPRDLVGRLQAMLTDPTGPSPVRVDAAQPDDGSLGFALYPPRGEYGESRGSLQLGAPYRVERTAKPVVRPNAAAVLRIDAHGRAVASGAAGAVELTIDLEACAAQPLPLADDSFDTIEFDGGIDRVRELYALLNELWRVARAGARLHIRVAHGTGAGAWRDPAQVRAFYEGSFNFYTQPARSPGCYVADWALCEVTVVRDEAGLGADELFVHLSAVKPCRASEAAKVVADERVDEPTVEVPDVATREVPVVAQRTLFLLHEQRFRYEQEPSYLELYLPMMESGMLGDTSIYAYQSDLRWAVKQASTQPGINAETVVEQLLELRLQDFAPTLVVYALTWPHECIPATVLAKLKQRHGFKLASVIWDHDETNPQLQAYDREIIAVSDCTVVADSCTRAEDIRSRRGPYVDFQNTERVLFMPMVPPRSLFQPRAGKLYDVTVSGSGEGHRLEICNFLRNAGFDVHRSGGMMPEDKLLTIEDYAEELARSRIVVNTQTQPTRVQVKGRVAQCLASGTLLLEQDNPESRIYLEGIEVDFWSTTEELQALVVRHLANPAAREAQASRARAAWERRYSAGRFVSALVAAVGDEPGSPRQQQRPEFTRELG